MKTWHVYRKTDGVFTGRRISARRLVDVKASCPAGCEVWAGPVDPRSQRVQDGQLVAYEPPTPDVTVEVAALKIHRQIAALEKKQARPVRDLLLDPHDRDARERLDVIHQQIVELRKRL